MVKILTGLWILLCVVVVADGYVRLAPSDPKVWHKPLKFNENKELAGGVERVIEGSPADLARLDSIIRQTPRTQVLAGSVDGAHLTYVTRSAVFGFPDYTTVELTDGQIRIFGRLRFGRSDLGVNRKRVDGWLDALQTR